MSRHIRKFINFLFVLMTAVPAAADQIGPAGAVYAMTNDQNSNEILVFDRAADGTLTLADTVATGGMGATTEKINDARGSQNPLILSPDNHWLLGGQRRQQLNASDQAGCIPCTSYDNG